MNKSTHEGEAAADSSLTPEAATAETAKTTVSEMDTGESPTRTTDSAIQAETAEAASQTPPGDNTEAGTEVTEKPARSRKEKPIEFNPGDALTDDSARGLYDRARALFDADLVDEGQLKQLRRDIDRWLGESELPETETSVVSTALERVTGKRHQQLEKRDRLLAIITDSLGRLETAVAEGNLKDAQSLEQKVTSRIAGIQGISDSKRQELNERMSALAPEIRKLKDWRSYGTDQARRKLIDEMIALKDSKMSEPQIASEIRRARETWQSWDQSGDKPGKGLWENFDKACTEAYERCKEYFEKQQAARAASMARREALCEKLESLHTDTDWKNPDWREIDKTVNAVRNDWRKAGHVDRKARKSIDKRYDEAYARIHDPLDRERKRCQKRREALIADVIALADEEDTRKAMDQVKEAQGAWKPTVLAHHRVERKLWKQFKTACDAVYERRKASYKERDAGFAAAKKDREEIIRQIEELATADDDAVLGNNAALAKLRSEYAEAGELGRRDRPGVEKRFRNAVKAFEKRTRGISRAKTREMQANYDTLLGLCIEVEAAMQAGGDSESFSTQRDAVMAASDADDSILQSLNARFDQALAAMTDAAIREKVEQHFDANREALESLCLELEVRAEIDSPAEFAEARMQLQVSRLAAAMGKGQKDDNVIESTRELLNTWWKTGPAAPGQMSRLRQRFERARAALKGER